MKKLTTEENFVIVGKIRHPIYLSTGAGLPSLQADEIIKRYREINVKNIELASGVYWGKPIRLKKYFENIIIHNYFPRPESDFVLNLASSNNKSMDFVLRAFQLAKEIGANIYSVHAGFVTDFKANELGNEKIQSQLEEETKEKYEKAKVIFQKNINYLAAASEENGIKIMYENNGVSSLSIKKECQIPRALLVTDKDIDEVIVTNPKINILLDLAHLKISSNAYHFNRKKVLRKYSENISGYHISDNDGVRDTNSCIGKNSWFMQHLAEHLKGAKEPIPLTIEVYGIDDEKIVSQYRVLKNAIEKKLSS
jgi:sugar phosphate isomerase/epimerase